MPNKNLSFAYDMCDKYPSTRKKMYRSKSVKRQRANMCSPGKMPRCSPKRNGMATCVRVRGSKKKATSKSSAGALAQKHFYLR